MAADKVQLDLTILVRTHWILSAKVESRLGFSKGKITHSEVGKSNYLYADGVMIKVEKLDCDCAAAMRCVAIFPTSASVHVNVYMNQGVKEVETAKGVVKLTKVEFHGYGPGTLVLGEAEVDGKEADEYNVLVVGTAGNKPVCNKCASVALPRSQVVVLPWQKKKQEGKKAVQDTEQIEEDKDRGQGCTVIIAL